MEAEGLRKEVVVPVGLEQDECKLMFPLWRCSNTCGQWAPCVQSTLEEVELLLEEVLRGFAMLGAFCTVLRVLCVVVMENHCSKWYVKKFTISKIEVTLKLLATQPKLGAGWTELRSLTRSVFGALPKDTEFQILR